jgi:Uma2 family endonuclease
MSTMAATTTHLVTVDEFLQLPEEDVAFYYELHHGEVVQLPRPKLKHYVIQGRLRDLLRAAAPPGGLLDIEMAFRALPEYEFRIADVAWVSRERWEQADLNDHIRGAPDLVIEVLSPSNTAAQIYDKEKLCLENGAKEFWVIDPDRRQVKISTPDGHTKTWRSGQEIPLPLFGDARLAVDSIFA